MIDTTNKLSSSRSSIPSMKPNPSARNSESKDPMRRSFSGNPFGKPSSILANSRGGLNPNTPANSPSDFTRRGSFGRENSSSLHDYEDKENSKGSNLRPGRVQSPASASKGIKNFMSPTISAASKFTTSPRKKLLVERNEPLRSSVSFSEDKGQVMEDNNVKPDNSSTKKKTVLFSDAISMFIEDDLSKPEMGLDEKKKIEASHDSTITDMGQNEALTSDSSFDSERPLDLKNDVGSSWETVTDCVNLHPTIKNSPRTSCSTTSPMLAPLDADPLLPPYDPKTNYLSPRPQFLHYKPNPRIELMHCKDRDGKRLEESFISENLSDSEASENLSEDSQKGSGGVFSDETFEEEGEEEESVEEEEELSVSEMIPISSHKPKSRFFTRSMFIALLLALVFASLSISVTDSPVTDLSMLKDVVLSNLYVPPEITEFTKVNFEALARKSQLWASNSFSYACKLISELREHKLGPLQYGNLTSLLEENHLVDGYPKFGHMDAGSEFKYQEYMMAPLRGKDEVAALAESLPESEAYEEDIEEVSEEDNDAEFEEQVHQDIDEIHDNFDEVVEDHTVAESDKACVAPPAEEIEHFSSEADRTEETTVESYIDNDTTSQSSIDVADQTFEIVEVTEIQPQAENDVITKAEENTQNTELGSSVVDTPQTPATVYNFLIKNVMGISSFALLSLLAAIAFFIRTKKLTTPNSPAVQSVMTKKLDHSPISVSAEHTLQEKLAASSRNWDTEVDDMILGESCPSEMSSFKSSSHNKGLKISSEAQSQERKPRSSYRRESLASSDISLSSYSYGSFTTYEKIPSKHGHGDDEVVTPVRRSSRIRKQATSP